MYLWLWAKQRKEAGWELAQLILERDGYGGIGTICTSNYYPGCWYKFECFIPKLEYSNKCAIDICKKNPGKDPLTVLKQSKQIHYYLESANRREDVLERKKYLHERAIYFCRNQWNAAIILMNCDKVTHWYLFMRACDMVMYGKKVADKSFPEPSNSEYSQAVAALVWLFEEQEAELIKKLEDGEEKQEREYIEEYCAHLVKGITPVSPPAYLEPRMLDAVQIQTIRNACIEEIKQGSQVVHEAAATIDEFARFCVLLAKPENHIQILSGQFVEKQVYTRTASDMKEDMVQELTDLDRYVAWTKTLKPDNRVLKGKIKTVSVSDYHENNEDYLTGLKIILERSRSEYCTLRTLIEEEIIKRQAKWRASMLTSPVPKQTDKGITGGQTNPPPTSSSI